MQQSLWLFGTWGDTCCDLATHRQGHNINWDLFFPLDAQLLRHMSLKSQLFCYRIISLQVKILNLVHLVGGISRKVLKLCVSQKNASSQWYSTYFWLSLSYPHASRPACLNDIDLYTGISLSGTHAVVMKCLLLLLFYYYYITTTTTTITYYYFIIFIIHYLVL